MAEIYKATEQLREVKAKEAAIRAEALRMEHESHAKDMDEIKARSLMDCREYLRKMNVCFRSKTLLGSCRAEEYDFSDCLDKNQKGRINKYKNHRQELGLKS